MNDQRPEAADAAKAMSAELLARAVALNICSGADCRTAWKGVVRLGLEQLFSRFELEMTNLRQDKKVLGEERDQLQERVAELEREVEFLAPRKDDAEEAARHEIEAYDADHQGGDV